MANKRKVSKPRSTTKQTEKRIEQYLRERVEIDFGGLCYKLYSVTRAGIPDRLCIFKKGVVVFVEVKGAGGGLSDKQQREHDRLDKLGQHIFTVNRIAEVDRLLEKIEERIRNVHHRQLT